MIDILFPSFEDIKPMVDNKILTYVGDRIRQFRKDRGWTLEDLSGASGLHPSSISQAERGERNLTLSNLERLAEGLEVEPFQLLLNTDEILDDQQEQKFKVENLLQDAPDDKKRLLYELSELLLDWEPENGTA